MSNDVLTLVRSELRKRKCEHDLFAFMHEYLPHHMVNQKTGVKIASADVHEEWCRMAEDAVFNDGNLVLAAPRGHSKTTYFSVGLPAWALSYKHKEHVVLTADTGINTSDNVQNVVDELKTNERLLADFGDELTPYIRAGSHRAEKDSGKDIVFKSQARLRGIQFYGKIRGKKHRAKRPDLIVMDDIENDENVENIEQRDKGERWVDAAALNALAPTGGTCILIGTVLHSDSILSRKLASAGWKSKKYRAEQPDGTVLWPAMWPQSKLNLKRAEIGDRMYSQEFLNEPIDDVAQTFKPEYFKFYDFPDDSVLHRRSGRWIFFNRACTVIIVVDPASRQKKKSDYSAITVLGSNGKDICVIDSQRLRVNYPDLKRTIRDLRAIWAPVDIVVVETVSFQKALADDLNEEGCPVLQIGYSQDDVFKIPSNKEQRIATSALEFEKGNVYFSSRSPGTRRLHSNLVLWPSTPHDDDIDSMAIGIHTVKQYCKTPFVGSTSNDVRDYELVLGF